MFSRVEGVAGWQAGVEGSTCGLGCGGDLWRWCRRVGSNGEQGLGSGGKVGCVQGGVSESDIKVLEGVGCI